MNYVGIDLGTTNSAICSYDGETIHLYKSPEQHDVTPSAIFIDKRGNKFIGSRAYNNAARSPGNSATLFKRMMGTSTSIKLPSVNLTMTPEDCSAEILKALYGYLPESIRNDRDTGTVITVPAAFNQMQKDATKIAAEAAGIGRMALMQEPVAAVMSVMRSRKNDGIFLVYDLGGGTLDIAIAESVSGRVSLLAHGGIAMCGGRDFDRIVFDNVVKPWLLEKFDLPEDLSTQEGYKSLVRMATLAAEKAKIALSGSDDVLISDPDFDGMAFKDESGAEIYLDIPFSTTKFEELIEDKLNESIQAARETIEKAQLSPHDIERVVFVGGPTQYKPLRDRVAFELGVAPSTDVNPMTAVAEGAAVFAESIDWTSQSRGRKSARGELATGGLQLTFNYISRTPDTKAKVVAKLGATAPAGAAFQIESLDTGWSSGRVPLKDGASVDLALSKPGDNTFKVWVFDTNGQPLTLKQDRITIARTAASVDAIPASHSVGIEVREKVGGPIVLTYLVKEGDPLPKKGKVEFTAAESLKAGAPGSINFKIWEGEISDPISDNRYVGRFQVRGSDFDQGVISKGDKLICEYEVLDSGVLTMTVQVPSIGGSFDSGKNYYSKDAGMIDFNDAAKRVADDSKHAQDRIEQMAEKIDDDRLTQAQKKLDSVNQASLQDGDPETTKQALDNIQEVKRLLAQARKQNLKAIRQMDLDRRVQRFNDVVRRHAKPTEATAFDNLARTAQSAINNNAPEFEAHLSDLEDKCFFIMWRQDWYVIDRFKLYANNAYLFPNAKEHGELIALGNTALQANDMDKLRQVVYGLDVARYPWGGNEEMLTESNILRS